MPLVNARNAHMVHERPTAATPTTVKRSPQRIKMTETSLMMRVRAALQSVRRAQSDANVVAEGRVRDLSASPAGVIRVDLKTEDLSPDARDALVASVETAVAAVDGAERAVVVASPAPSTPSHDDPFGLRKRARIKAAGDALTDVKTVIAVASGKGGVGKSTLAANLAVACARRGRTVGLLDADIYGPSLPTLLGLESVRPTERDGRLQPIEAHGLRTISIGYLVEPEKALAWRGPMVMGAVRQLINDVDWGALDVLVIDTPPGTGDAHLTLAQAKILSGAVIVSTPQKLALDDVRRGVELFRKVGTPILGVVENMAWFEAGDGGRTHLFGEGGARKAAADLGVPFLGEIPLLPGLRAACDAGVPPAISAPDGVEAGIFDDLAAKVLDAVAAH